MTPTQELAIKRAQAFLTAANVLYLIKLEDGSTIGNLKIEQPIQKKRRDEVFAYISPPINAMVPTDILRIPAGKFELAYLSKRCSTYAHKKFGSANYVCRQVKADNEVEILRIF